VNKRFENRLAILKESILAKRLNVFDCLEYYELTDVWDGSRREQQIKCPGFHGDDRRKSARIYENGTMFCWACDSSYDIFAFEMKYAGQSFSDAVYALAQRYGIEFESLEEEEDEESRSLSEIKDLFKRFETNKPKKKFEDYAAQISQRLLKQRSFLSLEDYQRYWYIVDQITWRVSSNTLAPDQAIIHLESLYREVTTRRV